jgi:hypothetical protein
VKQLITVRRNLLVILTLTQQCNVLAVQDNEMGKICSKRGIGLHSVLVKKTRRKKSLGFRRRWVNNIKMDLREMGWRGNGFIWLRIETIGGLL